MPTKQNESHIHHYVPRSVLRRFSVDAERKYVVVFDKVSGRSWDGGLTNVGSDKGYNTLVRSDGGRLNFESDFDQIDADYARIGDELAACRSLSGLDTKFRTRLADVALVQLLRTPIVRSTLENLSRDLVGQMRAMGVAATKDSDLPDASAVRQSTRDLIARRAPQRQALLSKDLFLFEPTGAARFWTSDHPVACYSKMPLGETGLESLGVEVYLPIASDLLVGFLCPSLRTRSADIVDGNTTRSIAMEEVLRAGIPLRVADPVVNFFNSLQVQSSQRFLYASNNDFDLVRKLLQVRPDFSSHDTLFQMGEMGKAPPRPSNIPPGEWLYLENSSGHGMIPISDYRSEGFGQEMSTECSDLLAAALKLGTFTCAEVFASTGGGGMRGVGIEIIDAGPPARFRLVFADPSLRALDAAIAGHSNKE